MVDTVRILLSTSLTIIPNLVVLCHNAWMYVRYPKTFGCTTAPPNLNGSVAQSLYLANNCTHDMFVDIIQLTKWWPLFQSALNFIVYMTSSTVYMDINYSTVNVRVGIRVS